ncbi:amidohydrolase [Pacificimonas sp. WHA3]|uniref:Amidohydrolase n=1 Tax=Pacificimonas pallii TaxID=2827236 RepID=A0ABS6SHQ0_9SPHN|nr:amidohydrolase [Pacificimonas pallii]MBV7257441.1 amidohydrolase [Pacificimonas pallii]
MTIRLHLILLTALSLFAGQADARTIFTNANGYTLDEVGRLITFDTLVVGDDGRVEQTMSSPARPPNGEIVDVGGRTMLPGLIDAHGHVMGLGQGLMTLDLSGTKTLEEALAAVAGYAAANPDLAWIRGRGWNQVTYGMDGFPTAAQLDEIVSDRPVILERVDGHASWVNSAAIRAAGITAATVDPDGGRIERGADGKPAGTLIDAASALVHAVMPAPTTAQLEAALTTALRKMAATGLTGVADMGTTPAEWAVMRRFGEEGRLTARIAAYAGGMDALADMAPSGPSGWLHGDRLALVGVKLYGDGALGSRGAAMIEPYSDDPGNTGLLFVSGAELRNQFVSAASRGFAIAFHAIGDAANREALDAFADILAYVPGGRHRIEHAQIIAAQDLPRFAELGIIASMQPTHATSDKAMAENRVGPDRIRGGYAWKTLMQSGARFAAGSDFPVEPPEPLYGLHAAITRQDRDGEPPEGWYPEESLGRQAAFGAFTTGAAYAAGAETRVGTLTGGKWADFVILDADPFQIDAGDIWSIAVEETWLAGERVFARDTDGNGI